MGLKEFLKPDSRKINLFLNIFLTYFLVIILLTLITVLFKNEILVNISLFLILPFYLYYPILEVLPMYSGIFMVIMCFILVWCIALFLLYIVAAFFCAINKNEENKEYKIKVKAIIVMTFTILFFILSNLSVSTSPYISPIDKAKNSIEIEDLEHIPDELQPITFAPESLPFKEKERYDVQVGFYNSNPTENRWLLQITDTKDGKPCGGIGQDGCYGKTISITYKRKTFKLAKDQAIGWNMIFEPQDGAVDSISPGSFSADLLLNITFCAVKDDKAIECPADSPATYSKELYMEIRR